MSEAVNKVSVQSRQTDYDNYHEKIARAASPGATVSPLSNDVDVTSYSALLDEAYDGDLSEYIAVGQSDRRAADVSDVRRPDIAEEFEQQDEKGPAFMRKGHLEKLSQNKQVQHIETSNDGASEHRPRISIKNAHDRFMLTSSQLNCTEAGSRACLKAFLTVVTVLHHPSWERMDYLERHLVQNQMAVVL
ncbi:hypothetical protein [Ochrobactrum sp. Marseille-Q0166]|uniref:hypothetical protein n=1 Tax=Ochrobactrum sp. Marseille-Q0166 TaxID=2761105 RepID=UPI0016561233|nr:hypothetical protein [Ochrobactrum sp. Marseille-Q0166]MBC8719580.1 hypothetical protein [Ochrobactrum sp. Marseille-Q0166]